jgi:hypothetical protein
VSDLVIPVLLGALLLAGAAVVLVRFFGSRPELPLVILGLLAWGAAVLFALLPVLNTVNVHVPEPSARAPAGGKVEVQTANPASAGVSCGFAVGGGLCFLGAALAVSRDGGSRRQPEGDIHHPTGDAEGSRARRAP